jgi:hypothetical protein
MPPLSNQIIEFIESHTRVLMCNFTQHSEPFKHDTARWTQQEMREELQPKTVGIGPIELETQGDLFASAHSRPAVSSKKFFKNKAAACAREGYCADLGAKDFTVTNDCVR